jgi:2-polyprenyl-6-methoxyphenol hydroxylase-like FAD-dependent oxidoreductase
MDLSYPGAEFGLGVHRGALFSALRGAAERAGVRLLAGAEVVGRSGATLIDAGGGRYGPYELLVGADGARSTLRRFVGARARVHEHGWGALWGIFPDPDGVFTALDQYFDGAGRMAGFLPTGTGGVSLFWSVRLDRLETVRAAGVEAFRADLFDLVPAAAFLQIASMQELLPATYRTVWLPRWHDGQLVLLGDAAHALSPQLGQGANLALMDAAALADASSLDAYEAARRPAARFYAFGARALNVVWQNSFEPAAWPRDHLLGPVSRLPGMRGLMLRTLSGSVFM